MSGEFLRVELLWTLTLMARRPESLGLVCASIYILLLIVFIPFPFSDAIADGNDDVLHSQVCSIFTVKDIHGSQPLPFVVVPLPLFHPVSLASNDARLPR